jgi:hypothetical protein
MLATECVCERERETEREREREMAYIKSRGEDSVLCLGDWNVYVLIYIQNFVLNTCTRTRTMTMLD